MTSQDRRFGDCDRVEHDVLIERTGDFGRTDDRVRGQRELGRITGYHGRFHHVTDVRSEPGHRGRRREDLRSGPGQSSAGQVNQSRGHRIGQVDAHGAQRSEAGRGVQVDRAVPVRAEPAADGKVGEQGGRGVRPFHFRRRIHRRPAVHLHRVGRCPVGVAVGAAELAGDLLARRQPVHVIGCGGERQRGNR